MVGWMVPVLAVIAVATALAAGAAPFTVPLWPDGAPGALGNAEGDRPEITVHLPPGGRRPWPAVVICPGGGYVSLMMTYEGHDIARWLNEHGVAGVVLRYRIAPYKHPTHAADGERAMRLVRSRAKEWGIDPRRIGMMGFSAGGHLASWVATHPDPGFPAAPDPVERETNRPDFLVLVYPAIEYAGALSTADLVSRRTPPTFLVHAATDEIVPCVQSDAFHAALKAKRVPCEYLRLAEGAHGLGCGKGPLWERWQAACLDWMRARGIIRR